MITKSLGVIVILLFPFFSEASNPVKLVLKRSTYPQRTTPPSIIYGTDGGVPQTKLTAAIFKKGLKSIHLDCSGCYNPWSSTKPTLVAAETVGGILKIYLMLSDGAGMYCVVWRISENKSVREIISNDSEILISIDGKIKKLLSTKSAIKVKISVEND